jgi:2-octaprenyl-6-methoxyphenol hydroxylase
MLTKYDIVIAGGGMVGASLACALSDTNLRIALVEAISPDSEYQPSYDERGLALSLSSKRIFQALKVWHQVEANANPIKRVHVSDRGHFGKVRMDAASMGLEALGYVVIARELGTVLMSRLRNTGNVDLLCPAQVTGVRQQPDNISLSLSLQQSTQELSCKLLVVADGARSGIREQLDIKTEITDYNQTAIVCNVTTQIAHADTAYERFTETGPLALLPLKQNRSVVVFTVPTEEAEHYLQVDNDYFLEEIQKRFGRRLGKLAKVSSRHSYPMVQLLAQKQVEGRAVLLGNSAHTIHPNGAQGFNLCLRDVAGLAEHLVQDSGLANDPGDKHLLESYLNSRLEDQQRVSRLSHGMTRWFYNNQIIRAATRNVVMTLVDLVPSAKASLMRRGMGIWGKQPALVRGLEL